MKLNRRGLLKLFSTTPLAAPGISAMAKDIAAAPLLAPVVVRTGLPEATWRKFNAGLNPNNTIQAVVDLRKEHNEIMEDLVWQESSK